MEAADWATSSVIFVVAVSIALVMSSHLVAQDPPDISESQLQEILESVTDEIEIRSMILKHDCNADFDCNREYPVEVDVQQAKHNFLSQSYTQDENKIYSVMPLGSVSKLYSFTRQKIAPNYPDAVSYTLTSDANVDPETDTNNLSVSNQHLTATITDSNTLVEFSDSSAQDLLISYPRMHIAKLTDTNTQVIFGNDANQFFLRFFPNSAEFWIDMPDDINITINPAQQNWQLDENIGVFNEDRWWDNDATDAYIWHYRIPLVFHSRDTARTDIVVQADVNMLLGRQLYGFTNVSIDPNSFRLVEYNDFQAYDSTTSSYDDSTALTNQPFHIAFNPTIEMARVTWRVLGTTPANEHRVYYLYFDFTDFPKPAVSYASLSYSPPDPPVYITTGRPQANRETFVFDTNSIILFNPNTLLLNTVNQLARVWQYNTVSYRKPLVYDSGKTARAALTVSADINFIFEFAVSGCAGCDLNLGALSLVQVNNWGEGKVIENFTQSDENTAQTFDYSFNSTTKVLNISWTVPPTPALTKRFYFLYFDSGLESEEFPDSNDNVVVGWHNTDQTITLSATDNSGTGINSTYYCVDSLASCNPSTVYSSPISVTCATGSVCQKYIRYYSTDNYGHQESIQTSNRINIDKAFPVTTSNEVSSTYYADTIITLTPTDTGSGVSSTYYCVDSLGTCSPTTSGTAVDVNCTQGSTCNKYVRFYSVDAAGNQESTKTSTKISIDRSSDNWLLTAWNHRKTITFSNSAQTTNLQNFPVLITLTSNNFDYSKANSSGNDLRFTDPDGSLLEFEIEKWDYNSTSNIWVKVPQIDAYSNSDFIYIYYGNNAAASDQNAAGVWNNSYKMVQHFHENSATISDSTLHGNDATVYGAASYSAGKTGNCFLFDGTDDYMLIANDESINFPADMTIEAWIKTSSGSNSMQLLDKFPSSGDNGYGLELYSGRGRFTGKTGSATLYSVLGSNILSNDQWHYVVGRRTSGQWHVFVDGLPEGSAPNGTGTFANNAALTLGIQLSGAVKYFNGLMDEVRVSNTAHSNDWIHASYLSTSNSFVSFGEEESS